MQLCDEVPRAQECAELEDADVFRRAYTKYYSKYQKAHLE
jgi:hypothetical protein